MRLLQDKGRDYRRWRHTPEEAVYLGLHGLQQVLSSNVSSVGTSGADLIIRFHNGSLYEYKNQAKRYRDIMGSNSKGKWVWQHLRRARVPYRKIGALPLPDDVDMPDSEIIELGNRFLGLEDLPQFLGLTAMGFEILEGNAFNILPAMGQIAS